MGKSLIEAVRDSLYAAKICSYAQGFALMRAASEEQKWSLNLRIEEQVRQRGVASERLLDAQNYWRKIVVEAALSGLAIRRSPRRWLISTAATAHGFRRTCYRPSVIISAPIPTSGPTHRAENLSTTTGAATGSIATFNTPHAQCASPSATPKTAITSSFLTGKSWSALTPEKPCGNSPHNVA